jgi:hypothetical protein
MACRKEPWMVGGSISDRVLELLLADCDGSGAHVARPGARVYVPAAHATHELPASAHP